jgi:hypothetical protein
MDRSTGYPKEGRERAVYLVVEREGDTTHSDASAPRPPGDHEWPAGRSMRDRRGRIASAGLCVLGGDTHRADREC